MIRARRELMGEAAEWFVIANPASARGRGRDRWLSVERRLRAQGIALEIHETAHPGQGEQATRQALDAGRRHILVAGGDGTVHEAVNGIMSAGIADTRSVTLAVAPVGTGNDWSRSLGLPADPSGIARMLTGGQAMLHDVGRLEFPDARPPFQRWFINVAGAGYDAHVITKLPTRVPSRLAYLKGAVSGLTSYRSPRFRISADETVIEDRLLLAFVANGQFCGNRMHVAPRARVDDGLLDLVTVQNLPLLGVLFKLGKLYRGSILGDPAVNHLRSSRIRIDAAPVAQVEADGQLLGPTPVECSVCPSVLRVAVP